MVGSLRNVLLKDMIAQDKGRLFCDTCEEPTTSYTRVRLMEIDRRLAAVYLDCQHGAPPDVVLY